MEPLSFVIYVDGRYRDSVPDQDIAEAIALTIPGERRIDIHDGPVVLQSLHWYEDQAIWVPAREFITATQGL